MKKKLLIALLAAVLGTPQVAFAARDGEGMQYTSASEGFYGSIRTVYKSKNDAKKTNGGILTADSSRLGVQGTLDLGHGLTGLYRYEWGIEGENGVAVGKTRLSYVGLRGSFGEFVAGSHWSQSYNWVTAATDIASTGSGNFVINASGESTFRRANSFQYITPDLNGFQGSFRFAADGKNKQNGNGQVTVNMTNVTSVTLSRPSENLDEWAVAGIYTSHGFTFGGTYEVRPDAIRNVVLSDANITTPTVRTASLAHEDATFWALRGGYSQDNWAVNAWYGERNSSKERDQSVEGTTVTTPNSKNTKIFSLAGNIDLGKFALVGIYEKQDNKMAQEDSVFIFNADYNFTSQSKAYVAYIANDFDSDNNKEDEIRLGMRLDF